MAAPLRTTYQLDHEPRGADYLGLLYRAFPWCSEVLLVVAPLPDGGDPLLAMGRRVLAELESDLIRVSEETEWPGTRLDPGQHARVHRYRLRPPVLDTLAAATDRLYGWRPPQLPQDIALLRGDGTPFLATVTSEGWGALTLDEHERTALMDLDLELSPLWS